jgi:hypothetical protein
MSNYIQQSKAHCHNSINQLLYLHYQSDDWAFPPPPTLIQRFSHFPSHFSLPIFLGFNSPAVFSEIGVDRRALLVWEAGRESGTKIAKRGWFLIVRSVLRAVRNGDNSTAQVRRCLERLQLHLYMGSGNVDLVGTWIQSPRPSVVLDQIWFHLLSEGMRSATCKKDKQLPTRRDQMV